MNKSSEDVEREVEATRGNLDRTVEALKEKMTPPQIFDELLHGLGSTSSRVISGLGDQVRENPVPLAMIGLGLAWLAFGSRRGPDQGARAYSQGPYSDREYYDDMHRPSRRERAMEKVSGVVSQARDKVSDAVASVRDAELGTRVHALAGSAIDHADDARRAAQRKFSETLDRDPLIFGALGLVAGVAVGAALPATRIEDRFAGPLRDKVLDKATTVAHQGLEGVRDAAQAAYGGVKSELSRNDPETPFADRAAEAARAGIQAAQDELGRPH